MVYDGIRILYVIVVFCVYGDGSPSDVRSPLWPVNFPRVCLFIYSCTILLPILYFHVSSYSLLFPHLQSFSKKYLH